MRDPFSFRFRLLLRAIVTIGLIAPSAFAANLFVSTTGNDANSCFSAPTACLTIQAAVNKSANGDFINIGPGTFSGPVLIHDRSNLRFVGSGAATIITHPGPTGPNVAVVDVSNSRLVEFHNLRLTGHASSDGFRVFYSTSVTFNGCVVDNNGGPGGGFFINGSMGVIINNSIVEDNGTGIRVDANSAVAVSSPPFAPANSIVQRNGIGILIRSGDLALQGSSIVQENGTGIFADGGRVKFCCEGETAPRRIRNNDTGIHARTGSSIEIRGSTEITGNASFGLRQFGGGVRISGNVLFSGNGPVNAGVPAIIQAGGHLFMAGGPEADERVVIENNRGPGMLLTDAASTRLANVTIRNNGGHGLRLQALSAAVLAGGILLQNNGGKDLSCTPNSFARGDNSGVDTQFCPGFDNSPDPGN